MSNPTDTVGRYVMHPIGDGIDFMQHLDDVAWHDAPVPKRWHTCWTQTFGAIGLTIAHRCACGAISRDGQFWIDRNARKRSA